MKKTPVYMWKEQIQIIDMKALHDANPEGCTRNRPVTPAENAANVLSVLPSSDVERLWEIVILSVRYSQELNETDSQMKDRIHTSVMTLTSEHKRTFDTQEPPQAEE